MKSLVLYIKKSSYMFISTSCKKETEDNKFSNIENAPKMVFNSFDSL